MLIFSSIHILTQLVRSSPKHLLDRLFFYLFFCFRHSFLLTS